ncbi:hypothetical protein E4U55_005543 [Claviceps digitariae]|nr:hypothetical protein E4U55_005543 [Claviceps digitariae]
MKLSIALGSLLFCALEVYAEYCCVSSGYSDHRDYKFVLYTGFYETVYRYGGDCELMATQSSRPPSAGGCADWKFSLWNCAPDYPMPSTWTEEAAKCQSNP